MSNIEDYKNKVVRVWNIEGESYEFELLGDFSGNGVIAINEDGMMERFDRWEPIPEVKPITVLDLMKAGMFWRNGPMDEPVFSIHNSHMGVGCYERFSKDPTAPIDQWKKFEDLNWSDLE